MMRFLTRKRKKERYRAVTDFFTSSHPFSSSSSSSSSSFVFVFVFCVVKQKGATERSFTGETTNGFPHDNKADGVYVSAVGGLPLFDSRAKFDSGTGWPSFFAPIASDHVVEKVDRSIPFMPRVEIVDAKSGAHLGHVFEDGPKPTGKRYCMNAAAMKFLTREEFEQLQQEINNKQEQ